MTKENPGVGSSGAPENGSENGSASTDKGSASPEFVEATKAIDPDSAFWLIEDVDDFAFWRRVDSHSQAAVMPDGPWLPEYTAALKNCGVGVEIFQSNDPSSRKRAKDIARELCGADIPYEIVQACGGLALWRHIELGRPVEFHDQGPNERVITYGIEIMSSWDGTEPKPDFRTWDEIPEEERLVMITEKSPVFDDPEIIAHVLAEQVKIEAEQAKDKIVNAMMDKLLDADGLEEIPDPEWLIKGWLTQDTLARINGEPNTGKSLVALDWAGCVGTGTPWHGCETVKGTVLYVIAEGVRGFKKRKRAWVKHYGKPMSGVLFYPEPVQIRKPDGVKAVDQWATLADVCERIKPVLIVLDTQSRVTVGVEENSNTEMGMIVARLEAMRKRTGACVLLAHHTPKGGEGGRGAGAMAGAINTEFMMIKRGRGLSSVMSLENIKEKDEEDGKKILLRFKVYGVGEEDPFTLDDPMTSVVLIHEEDETAEDVIPVVSDTDDNRSKFRSIVSQVWPIGRFTQAQACSLARTHGGMTRPTAYRVWDKLIEDQFIEPIPHATTGNPTEKFRIKRTAGGETE